MKIISRATITASLISNDRAVEKAMVILYNGQTEDERSVSATKHTNGCGFNSCHAHLGTYYAKWVLSGKNLTGKHLVKAREIALYYAGTQLLQAAHAKIARGKELDARMVGHIIVRDPFQRSGNMVGVGFLL